MPLPSFAFLGTLLAGPCTEPSQGMLPPPNLPVFPQYFQWIDFPSKYLASCSDGLLLDLTVRTWREWYSCTELLLAEFDMLRPVLVLAVLYSDPKPLMLRHRLPRNQEIKFRL